MKVGIIGCGTMGTAIAQVFVESGYCVLLVDITIELAEKAKERILASFDRLIEKGRLFDLDKEFYGSNLSIGTLQDCADCHFILEAAAEDYEIKHQIFSALDKICTPDCIFASNTSSISITQLSGGLSRPVVGMHFFNPATTMKLVEVISGLTTPAELVDWTMDLARLIGKEPVRVQDDPGFVVNRILTPMLNEAIGVFAAGTASAADIDKAMVLGCNMPMGPLKLCDLCGLDVVLAVCETLHRETGDQKYAPHPLLRKMVRAGQLGKKSGEGFYIH